MNLSQATMVEVRFAARKTVGATYQDARQSAAFPLVGEGVRG